MSATQSQAQSLIETLAEKAGIPADTYYDALVRVPFAQCKDITREEMTGVLLMAKKLDLDPFAKEIYAVPGRFENAPITPVIAFDGWMKILLRQPTYDGMETFPSESMITPQGFDHPVHEYCEVVIYDKNRSRPVRVREYFQEVQRVRYYRSKSGELLVNTNSPWVTMPWRMLRAKTIIQGVRNAYPVGGFEANSEFETDPGFIEPQPALKEERPRAVKPSTKVSKPGFPTLANKEALTNLLDKLAISAAKEETPLDSALGWIAKNLAADTQEFASRYVREKLLPAEVPTPVMSQAFDFDGVNTEERRGQVQSCREELTQTAVSVPSVPDNDPLGGPDADCYGLESFVDDVDIDRI